MVNVSDQVGEYVTVTFVESYGPWAVVAVATSDVEVGQFMYCAGADPNYQPFLANPVEVATAMVHRNCVVPIELCHRFAGSMVERGRGGIIVLSSGAGFVGAPNMVIYGGTKAFDVVFTEALWTELHPRGVDVLSLVLGETDTPALRRLRAERGFVDDPDVALPGVATVEEVAADALARLSHGPSWIVGDQMYAGMQMLGGMPRGDAVDIMMKAASATMDHDDSGS